MKITDLRVGNMVKVNDFHTVLGLDGHTHSVRIGHIWMDIDRFTPIPLTREILAQVSFLTSGTNAKGSYFEGIVTSKILCLGSENKGVYEARFITNDYDELKRVQYLHDLQNAYWLFTGEEMKMKNEGI